MWCFNDFPNNTAVIDQSGLEMTYTQLQAETNELANYLSKERSLIFIFCNNTFGDFLGYVAAIQHSQVPALLSNNLDIDQEKYLIEQYKPRYLWIQDDFALTRYENYKVIYSKFGFMLLENIEYENQLYEELALLLTTSGSTGSPKFVRQSYKNILANAVSIAEYLELTPNERPITTLPMNYTYGLSIINSHLLVGATILITDKSIMQKEFWTFFKANQATSFGGVPYTYEMLKRLKFFNMDLPSLKTMTQAGGKLLVNLHEEFARYAQETGRQFIVMYGQCEATARMAYLPADKSLTKIGSMGIAIPGGKLILSDGFGHEITKSRVPGELIYYGPNVTLGYAQQVEDLLKGDERHGKLETGDMAELDDDGYFYIVGRKKRFLKLYGNRVNLDEIERILKSEFPLIEATVSGRDDALWIFSTSELEGDNMKKYLAKKTNINSRAFKYQYIKEIPKNSAGKTLYKELERYYCT